MKQNIYEIPKVHPFIKALEKIKTLRDNLDEHMSALMLWIKNYPSITADT